MKRIFLIVFMVLSLVGCQDSNEGINRALLLRDELLSGNGCSFQAEVTADYGDEVHIFSLECTADRDGNLSFVVLSPDSISGVEGRIDAEGGKLTYEDKILGFSLLADDHIAPVCAPWILLKTLQSGYIKSCEANDQQFRLQIDDSYQEDALHLDICLNQENIPTFCEILWQGRRILSMNVTNFSFL